MANKTTNFQLPLDLTGSEAMRQALNALLKMYDEKVAELEARIAVLEGGST